MGSETNYSENLGAKMIYILIFALLISWIWLIWEIFLAIKDRKVQSSLENFNLSLKFRRPFRDEKG